MISWETSITPVDVGFCLEALDRAIRGEYLRYLTPIRDQGAQFTSTVFKGKLEGTGIRISMDGRGRVFDNIFIERLWRSVKHEEVYLKDYKAVREAVDGLRRYFDFYNNERLHQSLEYRTPATLYFSERKGSGEYYGNDGEKRRENRNAEKHGG